MINKLHKKLYNFWLEHGIALLLYAILSIGLTWPTLKNFTVSMTSNGGDARHELWVMWYMQQALLGNRPMFYTDLLYYPLGTSLLTHGIGIVAGLISFPFWYWGAEAANNGLLLVGFLLTGYFMYLLARSLDFEREVAIFAGVYLMASEMHLAGLLGHTEKIFLGLFPLALLTTHHIFNPKRSNWWPVATAFVLLLTLLYSGWQFIIAVLGVSFFLIVGGLNVERANYWILWKRSLIFGGSVLVLIVPLLTTITIISRNPALLIDKNLETVNYQPDLIEFFLPSRFSLLFGASVTNFLRIHDFPWSIETTISLSYSGIILCILAFIGGHKSARTWLLFVLCYMIFTLGPFLKIFGEHQFTEYNLPIILPYAFLTALPGFDFMRTPGRFMLMGFVGVGITSSFGLTRLIQYFPSKFRYLVSCLAITLVLVESWPQPWPQEKLRPVPQFYQQIANDKEMYGVFDLPIKPSPSAWYVSYSSYYQIYQMTHHKGIVSGYLDRTYFVHPLFLCLFLDKVDQPDVRVNNKPVNCYDTAESELARHNYRYVVWHKPQSWDTEYQPGSYGDITSQNFIKSVFGKKSPLVDDELVTVYQVATNTTALTTTMVLLNNWYDYNSGIRLATSPATLLIKTPRQQSALLQIKPSYMYDPSSANKFGDKGMLMVQTSNNFSTSVEINANKVTTVPIELYSGVQTITMTLHSGNIRPKDYGLSDSRLLSFGIHFINSPYAEMDLTKKPRWLRICNP